jgi:hypothetical protein
VQALLSKVFVRKGDLIGADDSVWSRLKKKWYEVDIVL